jgi:YVTN family beta-propeller protein
MAGKYLVIILVLVIGIEISAQTMVSHYDISAIPSLDSLESESNKIQQKIPHLEVGEEPRDIAVDEDDNIVYVVNYRSDSISVIDADILSVSEVAVGDGPSSLAVDEDDNIVYVVNSGCNLSYDACSDSELGSNTVSVINETGGNYERIADIKVGENPVKLAVDENDNIVYVVNRGSDTVSVINGTGGNYTNIATVLVGESPDSIAIGGTGGERDVTTVYVGGSDTVSVINGTGGNYTNISNITGFNYPVSVSRLNWPLDYDGAYVLNSNGTVSIIAETNGNYTILENIPVGWSPSSIAIDERENMVFVADYGRGKLANGTLSILEVKDRNYTSIENITVGNDPQDIAVDQARNLVYIANTGSDTVSVINNTSFSDKDYTNIENITVGSSPSAIAIDEDDNIAYVVNTGPKNSIGPDTISVLSGTSQEVQAGVSFNVNPFHAGLIECNNITVPSNQYFFVDFRTQCTAQANQGYRFSTWNENLGGNSTRTLSASQDDWFVMTLDWLSGKSSPATLNITSFGNYTANFERVSPAIPPEYIATLFTVVITAFIGSWLTPTVIAWRKTKNDSRKMNYYHQKIASLEADGRLDENDIQLLSRIRREVIDTYSKGRINQTQYDSLMNQISILYDKIFRKRIDFIMNSDRNVSEQLNNLKDDIENSHSEQKITETQFNLLNKKILEFEPKVGDKAVKEE